MRIVILVLALTAAVARAQTTDPATVGHTTGAFGTNQCAATGDADDQSLSDPYLNALKNRDKAPSQYNAIVLREVVADKPAAAAAGKRRRDKWTSAQRKSVAAKEAQGISVEGYLAGIKQECPESCNCHDPDHVDFHLWLVENAGENRSQSMVVEISPRVLQDHQDWPALLNAAWQNGTYVRINGWRTWDQEHPEQLTDHKKNGKITQHATRATLWEIHPIHEIQAQDADGQWVDISQTGIMPDNRVPKASCQ